LTRLRAQARRLDLSIRTQRGTSASGERSYSLIERDGGRVLVSDLAGLTALERRLWLIARDRRQPVGVMRAELCAACGTPRVAFFRWCQTCGRDFEAERETLADTVSKTDFGRPGTGPARVTPPGPMPKPGPEVGVRRTTPLPGPTFVLTPPEGAATRAAVTSATAVEPLGHSTNGSTNGYQTLSSADRRATPELPAPLPAAYRPAASPPGRLARAVDNVRDSEWLDARRLALAAIVGLSIGVIVTLLLLAIQ
jgi:tetrahydromethanopterin S-methyltransferase subunit F